MYWAKTDRMFDPSAVFGLSSIYHFGHIMYFNFDYREYAI
jgi:hypothetical protein